jgi:hypothetical protein
MNHLTNRKCYVFGGARPLGAPKGLFLSVIIATGVLISSGDAFAQTTPYLQQSTKTGASAKTAPFETQTTKTAPRTSQSQFHQAKKEHGHGYSHGGGGVGVGVGVGATIDLSGIGQRRPEADPFAVPAGPQPVATRTEEKPKTPKKTREPAKTDPFAGVQLTGAQAKAETKPLSGELANDPWSQINPVSKDLSQTARKQPPPAKQNPQPSP